MALKCKFLIRTFCLFIQFLAVEIHIQFGYDVMQKILLGLGQHAVVTGTNHQNKLIAQNKI